MASDAAFVHRRGLQSGDSPHPLGEEESARYRQFIPSAEQNYSADERPSSAPTRWGGSGRVCESYDDLLADPASYESFEPDAYFGAR